MAHAYIRVGAMLLATILCSGCESIDKTRASHPVAPVGPRFTVVAREITTWQPVSAEVVTVDQSQAVARIAGILTTLNFHAGDDVHQGQIIGRIVNSQLGPQSEAYGAQAAAAQAQAASADADLRRVQFLYDNNVYAKARLDQAAAVASAARAQVRAIRSQESAVLALAGQGNVIAPATGRVLRADVPAGSAVAPGTVIAVLTAGATIVRLSLPESLASNTHLGARVRTSGFGAKPLSGQVVRVYPQVQAGQIAADVAIIGIGSQFIGRRVAAEIETGSHRALVVPAKYVTNAYGIDTVRAVAPDGSVNDVPVQTAPSDGSDAVEVLSGISPGDTLIVASSK